MYIKILLFVQNYALVSICDRIFACLWIPDFGGGNIRTKRNSKYFKPQYKPSGIMENERIIQ